jgi:hypothetical protein
MIRLLILLLPATLILASAAAQLEIVTEFNPSETGSVCGLGGAQDVWAYQCFGSEIDHYASDGSFLGSLPRPGGSANDVDLDVLSVPMMLAGVSIPAGTLLFFDGESGACEVYATDPITGTVLASLVTAFGMSHVVGGCYAPATGTLFLLQDRVVGGGNANLVAEIDPSTGAILSTFSTIASGVNVNFGDIDASLVTGNLYIVSSAEASIFEFTPAGVLVAAYDLPTGVGGLAGLATDDVSGGAWVASSSGTIWFLSGLVQIGTPYCSPAVQNSSGASCLIRAFGSEVRSLNGVRLTAFQLPSNSFGYFITSRTQGLVMGPGGSQGTLCLGGSVGRYNLPAQIFNSTGVGRASVDIDLGSTPTPAMGFISVMAGETWNYQAWYRDANPTATSNFSDGVFVTYQ